MDLYLTGIVIMFGYFAIMAYFLRRKIHAIEYTKHFHFLFIALLATFLLITGQARSQSVTPPGKQIGRDSVKNNAEREQLTNEVYHLRDSIDQTIALIAHKRKNSPIEMQKKLDKATGELKILYQTRVHEALTELNTTSKNGWNNSTEPRIRRMNDEIRREYKRILSDKKRYGIPAS